MSLIHRKSRPLSREKKKYRDDRLFIIACDDTYAPKQYFEFLQLPRVQVHVIQTEDGTSSAKYVLDRLLEIKIIDQIEEDERWLVLDVDHNDQPNHIQSFLPVLKEANDKGVKIALSKPCFELWLLLHHVDELEVGSLKTPKEIERRLRATLGEYNKTNLKNTHYPLPTMAEAYKRAKKLDSDIYEEPIPPKNTSRVYRIFNNIVKNVPANELPDALKSILNESSD